MQVFHPKHIRPALRRRVFARFALLLLALSTSAAAQNAPVVKPAEPDTRSEALDAKSLQEIIRLKMKRPRGPVLVAIPLAYRYGTDPASYYCSPSIRVTNSSNRPIGEIIVGIDFHQPGGNKKPDREVGKSITRIVNIDVAHQDTHFFYQLDTDTCFGVKGEVHIMRCVYDNGTECVSDVRASAFGAIPLKMAAP